MKRFLLTLLAGLVALAVVVVVRTLVVTPHELSLPPLPPSAELHVEPSEVAAHMAEAIRFPTVSQQAPASIDTAPFEAFIQWLQTTYPAVHTSLTRERVGEYSLLFSWAGSDPSLRPVLLMAHYDVVPILPGTEDEWRHPPFDGTVAEGYVWGRGALDDKGAVVALMEAATTLLKQGLEPERTLLLSFGHDEEVGGNAGAAAIAELLSARNVSLEWLLDEGSALLDGLYPGIDIPVASINVAEKGYVTLDLVARGEGGHSSMPPPQTAVGILAQALVELDRHPMPLEIDGVTREMFDALAPHMPFSQRMLFVNRWLFGGLLESALAASQQGNALGRTTAAPTMLNGSVKENVLAIEAVATVNFRLHPRDTVEDVIAHVTHTIDDDRVAVRTRGDVTAASRISSTRSRGFAVIARAVRQVYGQALVVPGLTVGGTDSKHYGDLADDIYRFNPMLMTPQDIAGMHGTNERISIENLVHATAVYTQLLKHAAAP